VVWFKQVTNPARENAPTSGGWIVLARYGVLRCCAYPGHDSWSGDTWVPYFASGHCSCPNSPDCTPLVPLRVSGVVLASAQPGCPRRALLFCNASRRSSLDGAARVRRRGTSRPTGTVQFDPGPRRSWAPTRSRAASTPRPSHVVMRFPLPQDELDVHVPHQALGVLRAPLQRHHSLHGRGPVPVRQARG
jgi:hypothetical protein